MELVLIAWRDVLSSPAAWMSRAEAEDLEPVSMLTVGWIVREEADFLTVAGTRSNDPETDLVGDINVIPRSLVSQVTRLADFWKEQIDQ